MMSVDLDEFFPIGKHKGKSWDQVPLDYLEWAMANLTSKPEIVEKCRRQIEMRSESQEQPGTESDPAEPTMGECARQITNAKTLDELKKTRDFIPAKHWTGVQKFYETRLKEIGGNDEDFDDDIPF